MTSAQDLSLGDTNWPSVASYVSTHKDTYPYVDPTKATMAGKSVLITGASKGIGKAAAISFAVAGCSEILLLARSDMADVESAVKDAARQAGRPEPLVHSLTVDLTSEKSLQRTVEACFNKLERGLDILINNAGYLEEWVPIAESKPSEWWHSWEVNIKGTYLATHYFLPLVLKSETKKIINITSGGAHVTFPGASAYQTTKFAICRFNEFINTEYGQQGAIAIAVHPGAVKTDLAKNMPLDRQNILTDTPELAADTLVWLCSQRCEWLSGRFVSVNWDMEELDLKKEDIIKRNLFKFRMTV
ncbi:short chain dehydrogenase reductase family [Fusarium heterosporum]|uniref:Short chain dehydrogenase reductase family n=1 Tax=Fusarium heterosporum TaxID=42747 RepID=A0A8H5WN41_FUSHE|nr:short chain dehydrogenase reductase family [Fusarium heterosporum]